eukprot:TRINITY_DN963_c0_g1_i4.p3 TRINITY_DN963_c0_g1~~TRINITY_DN963_c0_g1_i4.p3  ORF type:complete len:108 (+),score=32.19 TRINITY_DN963_c0_g1_i4:65-388(+)
MCIRDRVSTQSTWGDTSGSKISQKNQEGPNQMNPQGKYVQKTDLEVTKDDQASINKFSKFHTLFNEKNNELKQKRDQHSGLDEALTELELADDSDSVRQWNFFGLQI